MVRQRAMMPLGRAGQPANRCPFVVGGRRRCARGFTLLELLAVVTIIALLAALVVGMAGYADRATKVGRAKAEIAMLASAIEAFRADNGRYPTSSVVHYSVGGGSPYSWAFPYQWEVYNSWLLLSQLSSPASYLNLRPPMAPYLTNFFLCCSSETNSVMQVLQDPWGQPYIYYCTYPVLGGTVATNQLTCDMITKIWSENGRMYTNWCSVLPFIGGQVSQTGYDLYSLGPDQRTRVPGDMQVIYSGYVSQYGGVAATVDDDIWVDGGNR